MLSLRFIGAAVVALLVFGTVGCGDDGEPPASASAAGLAAQGELAFWDTLYGIADRGDEAVSLLSQAVALDPSNGKAQFRLGMIHMFRFSQSVRDFHNPTRFESDSIIAAHQALSAAVPLLPEDRRVPGFRAAATYMRGFVHGDQAQVQQGLVELRAAVTLYPEFNNFDFIGVVAPTVSADDPLYQEVLFYVGDPLNGACSPFDQPEICGNAGKAPHNLEGALILFGDLFAKAGDARKARGYYTLAGTPFPGTEGTWRFQSLIQDRLKNVAQRVALYKDGDPSNDPPLLGYAAEACAACHYK